MTTFYGRNVWFQKYKLMNKIIFVYGYFLMWFVCVCVTCSWYYVETTAAQFTSKKTVTEWMNEFAHSNSAAVSLLNSGHMAKIFYPPPANLASLNSSPTLMWQKSGENRDVTLVINKSDFRFWSDDAAALCSLFVQNDPKQKSIHPLSIQVDFSL